MRQKGFTLIELSIALVIIGLIVGGVLVGRDLIRTAEIRAQIKQIEMYNTSVNAFKTKFTCLPGDCASAMAMGLGDNGNGDSRLTLGNMLLTYLDSLETENFWLHLSNANMLDGAFPIAPVGQNVPGKNSPPLKLRGLRSRSIDAYTNVGGGVWAAPPQMYTINQSGHFWLLTARIISPNDTYGVYFPADTYAIDAKIDDGAPFSGAMTIALYCNTYDCSSGTCFCSDYNAPQSRCGLNGVYNVTDYQLDDISGIKHLCLPVIKATF